MAKSVKQGGTGGSRWKPGQSGNPDGRPPKGFSMAEVLRELLEQGENKPSARQIAEKAIAAAKSGDMRAIEFIFDRIDGKPKQSLRHEGDEENPVWVTVKGPPGE